MLDSIDITTACTIVAVSAGRIINRGAEKGNGTGLRLVPASV
ncbi:MULTISPECIES: hypothetical protein [Candidatus Ichthyocystis]|nr:MULTISPECIES: hypothetical protein [Ichthyocystis]